MPEVSKNLMQELNHTLENESQKLMDTTTVGFYIGSSMGLIFNQEIFNKMYNCYR
jgi:hypothetical protein